MIQKTLSLLFLLLLVSLFQNCDSGFESLSSLDNKGVDELSNCDTTLHNPCFFKTSQILTNAAETELYFFDDSLNSLFKVDLASGNRTKVSNANLPTKISTGVFAYDEPRSAVYLLDEETTPLSLIRFNLNDLSVEKLGTMDLDAPNSYGRPTSFKLSEDGTALLFSANENNQSLLASFNTLTGEKTILSAQTEDTSERIDVLQFTEAADSSKIYGVLRTVDTSDVNSTAKIEIIEIDRDTGTRTVISSGDLGLGPELLSSGSLHLHPVESESLILASKDRSLKINILNGDRELFLSENEMANFSSLTYTEAPSYRYSAPSNSFYYFHNIEKKIIKFSPKSAVHTTVLAETNMGSGPVLYNIYDEYQSFFLRVDERRSLAYAPTTDELISLNLQNRQRTVVLNEPRFVDDNALGTRMSDFSLHLDADTIYYANLGSFFKYTVSSKTLTRIYSKGLEVGTGEPIDFLGSFAMDKNQDFAYLYGLSGGKLVKLNVSSGHSELIADNIIQSLDEYPGALSVAGLNGDETAVFLYSKYSGTLIEIDLQSGAISVVFENKDALAVMSNDRSTLYFDDQTRDLKVFEFATGQLKTVLAFPEPVSSAFYYDLKFRAVFKYDPNTRSQTFYSY